MWPESMFLAPPLPTAELLHVECSEVLGKHECKKFSLLQESREVHSCTLLCTAAKDKHTYFHVGQETQSLAEGNRRIQSKGGLIYILDSRLKPKVAQRHG